MLSFVLTMLATWLLACLVIEAKCNCNVFSNLLSFLLKWDTNIYEWDTLWGTKSLVKACYSSLLTITSPEAFSNLWSFLLRCDTKIYEWDTLWGMKSLVKVCYSSLLTITSPEAPSNLWSFFCLDVAKACLNGAPSEA